MPVSVFERELVTSAKGRYKCRVMNADGSVAFEHKEWLPNLILDSGLDKIAYMPWASAFQWCVAGTGTTPTKTTTSSNASQSGTTVTRNSGSYSFTANDVGKLIYWPSTNTSARITAFSNSTTVTVNVSQAVSDAAFDLYHVNQTELVTPYSMNMRYQVGEGFCGHTVVGAVVTNFRTFDFYLETTPVLITELGFKESPAATTLFSRVVLPDPIYLSAGQWLQVSYQLATTLSPSSPNAKSPSVTGWPIAPATDTDGSEQIQLYGIAVVGIDGITRPYDRGQLANEPSMPGTNLLGPSYGYINRWTNGAGNPTKIYTRADDNPFTNPRNTSTKYEDAQTQNYIPKSVALGTSAMTYNTSGQLFFTSTNDTQYLFTSQDIGSIVFLSNLNRWVRITAINSTSSVTVTPGYTGSSSTTVTAVLYYRVGVNGSWGREITNAADCMQPVVVPPDPQIVTQSGITPGWNGTDPYTHFPDPVPDHGLAPWSNWQFDFSASTITPTSITLTAVPANLVSPTYQWQRLVNAAWVDIPDATLQNLAVSATDLVDPNDTTITSVTAQYRVICDDTEDAAHIGYVNLYAIRAKPSAPAYYIIQTNPQMALRQRWGSSAALVADSGPSGRVKSTVKVFRDTTELTNTAYSASVFPGVGKFSIFTASTAISEAGPEVYWNGSSGVQTGTTPYTITIKIETTTQNTVNWLLSKVDPVITDDAPAVDVSATAYAFLLGGGLEDVTGGSAFIGEATDAPSTIGTSVDRSTSRQVEMPLTLEDYTPQTFTRLKQATFLTNMANGTNWRTIGIGGTDPDTQVANRTNAAKYNGYVFVFDEAQTKLNTHYLTVNFRYTWDRDLSS